MNLILCQVYREKGEKEYPECLRLKLKTNFINRVSDNFLTQGALARVHELGGKWSELLKHCFINISHIPGSG